MQEAYLLKQFTHTLVSMDSAKKLLHRIQCGIVLLFSTHCVCLTQKYVSYIISKHIGTHYKTST